MVEGYISIMINDVLEVAQRPVDRSVEGSQWIYKIKYAANGNVGKYKARFVAKGYTQKEGINYEETFTPVAKYTFIQFVISLAVQMGWHIHQMDVKTTFLNEVIEKELIEDCKRNLAREFDMKDLGLKHYFLGLKVWQKDEEIFLSQGRYTIEILKRYKMQHCRPMSMLMITNWRKIDASEDEDVDPTLCR
eukprot:PITA_35008